MKMVSAFDREVSPGVFPGETGSLQADFLRIAMLSLHSNPAGELGTHDTGGMSVYVRELALELGCRGHRVDIYTGRNGADAAPVLELGPNVRLIHLDIGPNGRRPKAQLAAHIPAFFQKFQDFLSTERGSYHLVHSHYWLSGRLGDRARMLWGVPHVMTFHTLGIFKRNEGRGNADSPIRVANETQLARSCRRIVVATEREKDDLTHHYSAHPGKIGVVPCGVNSRLFRPVDPDSARRALNLPRDKKILLYVGRFVEPKGLERLLGAMALLRVDDSIRLLLVGGDGPGSSSHEAVVRLSKRYGVHRRVRFAGRVQQPDLPRYYSAADVLVVPSGYESFGMVALESLACGTPVVATPVGAMADIIGCGTNGIVVPGFSDAALAMGIASALAVFAGSERRQQRLRASALAYDWQHVTTAMLDQYGVARKARTPDLSPALGRLGAGCS